MVAGGMGRATAVTKHVIAYNGIDMQTGQSAKQPAGEQKAMRHATRGVLQMEHNTDAEKLPSVLPSLLVSQGRRSVRAKRMLLLPLLHRAGIDAEVRYLEAGIDTEVRHLEA